MAIPSREAVMAQVKSMKFGFFTEEEIRKLSVVHCVNPISFDSSGSPLPNGVYDPRMGPIDRFDSCGTCSLNPDFCPGHFGHIDLPFPVYNAFIFGMMYRFLQCSCFNCGKFKMSTAEVEKFVKRLKLIKQGHLKEAMAITVGAGKEKGGGPGEGFIPESAQNVGSSKRAKDAVNSDGEFLQQTGVMLQSYQETMTLFLKRMTTDQKCQNCKAVNPKLKKDGFGKVFVQPLSQKQIIKNNQQGTVILSPLSGFPIAQKPGLEYLTQLEVMGVLKKIWEKEGEILSLVSGGMMEASHGLDGYKAFFLKTVAVVPNRFRPPSFASGMMTEHHHSASLSKIVTLCMDIRDLKKTKEGEEVDQDASVTMTMSKWQALQEAVNEFIDSASVKQSATMGIRQFLEKKEGLFRKNMMGKRVNFACRSTISPDPYLFVGEIGVPPFFAKKLSFPERVTHWNADKLRELVERGAEEHPGAVAVEDNKGRLISLAKVTKQRRLALARTLYQGWTSGKKVQGRQKEGIHQGQPVGSAKVVYRHLKDGDLMLTNRQPTLHKPSLMAHRAKVLHGERTIRFHYANCATFNADFDGDEINLHLPQDHLCRAEGYDIVHADHQYIVPTDGKPIRGLIQDSVDSSVLLTKKDTFLAKKDYMQLVYAAIATKLRGEKLCVAKDMAEANSLGVQDDDIILEPPAILKPGPYWTGKQAVSTVIRNLSKGLPLITMSAKCKTPTDYWGDPLEGMVCFRHGYFAHGVIDKGQYGSHGLVHASQELYGNRFAGMLLSSLGRLFVFYFQMHGFTCGIGDCFLYKPTESARADLIRRAEWKALQSSAKVIGMKVGGDIPEKAEERVKEIARVRNSLSRLYRENADTGGVHDANVKGPMHQLSSQVVKICLPDGIIRPFRHNCLTVMTTTGAKGSFVNFSQISCLLGQQELEGRRVPRMMSGKTLPCFAPFDPGARSGGFIGDRFLSGLRPPEYYFHCMAGRDGLVDTSVKTANSGYLQRCLVKCMESLRVQYDGTVRDDSDGSIVQFMYGEDGLDVLNVSYLDKFKYIAENGEGFKRKLVMEEALLCSKRAGLKGLEKECRRMVEQRLKNRKKKKDAELNAALPVNTTMQPTILGATSEKFSDMMWDYIHSNPDGLLKGNSKKHLSPKELQQILELKYMESLAAPGESVGVIAAQSIGEPSTQMTLNTFHMAGRGEANVTLGIPRLREILMSAATAIKTPVMTLPMRKGKALAEAQEFANKLRKIKLAECLKGLRVEEYPVAFLPDRPGSRGHVYKVILEFHPLSKYPPETKLTWEELSKTFGEKFIPLMRKFIKMELKRLAVVSGGGEITVSKMNLGADEGDGTGFKGKKAMDKYEDDEDNEENVEGKAQYQGGRSEEKYDAPDDEDKEHAKKAEDTAKTLFGVLETMDEEEENEEEEGKDKTKDAKDVKPKIDPKTGLPVSSKNEKAEGSSEGKGKDAEQVQGVEDFSGALGSDLKVMEDKLRCIANFELPLGAPKLLMLGIAEGVAATVNAREFIGIDKCYVVEGDDKKPHSVQTDGINFMAGFLHEDIVDVNHLTTNDVEAMRNTYGVEAARSTIVGECRAVFGAYGIGVDARHLSLIGDHMTYLGGYRSLNRLGITTQVSPVLKMSFETATSFLRQAVLAGEVDPLRSPAARVAIGRPPLSGTGCMDIFHKWE
ncbi:hypothetical protein BSKO_08649 [Bryopsis sp. KO-2023]|nr:hypothetical protein BSKO_08649 [Bryopsis sp. KO-2023]